MLGPVEVERDEEVIPLDVSKVRALLTTLALHRGRPVSVDELVDAIWGENNLCVTARTIDSHIANIRKKLEDDPAHPRYIRSIRGVGYKLCD